MYLFVAETCWWSTQHNFNYWLHSHFTIEVENLSNCIPSLPYHQAAHFWLITVSRSALGASGKVFVYLAKREWLLLAQPPPPLPFSSPLPSFHHSSCLRGSSSPESMKQGLREMSKCRHCWAAKTIPPVSSSLLLIQKEKKMQFVLRFSTFGLLLLPAISTLLIQHNYLVCNEWLSCFLHVGLFFLHTW